MSLHETRNYYRRATRCWRAAQCACFVLHAMPDPPAAPLDCRLADLNGFWLQTRCGCSRSVAYPFRLMARQLGGEHLLRDVLPRLRCQVCGGRPVSVVLVDDPAAGAHGGSLLTTSVKLIRPGWCSATLKTSRATGI